MINFLGPSQYPVFSRSSFIFVEGNSSIFWAFASRWETRKREQKVEEDGNNHLRDELLTRNYWLWGKPREREKEKGHRWGKGKNAFILTLSSYYACMPATDSRPLSSLLRLHSRFPFSCKPFFLSFFLQSVKKLHDHKIPWEQGQVELWHCPDASCFTTSCKLSNHRHGIWKTLTIPRTVSWTAACLVLLGENTLSSNV